MPDEFEVPNEEELRAMSLEDRAKARVKGPGPYPVPLSYPFTASFKVEGSQTEERAITTLMVRRPKMKELTDSAGMKSNHQGLYWLVGKLTRLPEAAVHDIDPDDFAEVEALIEVFTEKFQKAGKTSSAT
ncbi:MAG: hypothetical protein GC184_14615 [Rhizobiales bacterium]|nr:hypothetical protein [Hyphomicrobiales bacterium]